MSTNTNDPDEVGKSAAPAPANGGVKAWLKTNKGKAIAISSAVALVLAAVGIPVGISIANSNREAAIAAQASDDAAELASLQQDAKTSVDAASKTLEGINANWTAGFLTTYTALKGQPTVYSQDSIDAATKVVDEYNKTLDGFKQPTPEGGDATKIVWKTTAVPEVSLSESDIVSGYTDPGTHDATVAKVNAAKESLNKVIVANTTDIDELFAGLDDKVDAATTGLAKAAVASHDAYLAANPKAGDAEKAAFGTAFDAVKKIGGTAEPTGTATPSPTPTPSSTANGATVDTNKVLNDYTTAAVALKASHDAAVAAEQAAEQARQQAEQQQQNNGGGDSGDGGYYGGNSGGGGSGGGSWGGGGNSGGGSGGGSTGGGGGSTGGSGGGSGGGGSTGPGPRGSIIPSGSSCTGSGGSASANWASNLMPPGNAGSVWVTFENPGDSWGIAWECDFTDW